MIAVAIMIFPYLYWWYDKMDNTHLSALFLIGFSYVQVYSALLRNFSFNFYLISFISVLSNVNADGFGIDCINHTFGYTTEGKFHIYPRIASIYKKLYFVNFELHNFFILF